MTEFDLKFLPLADEMIKRFGKSMTIVTENTGEYDATTGEAAVTTGNKKVKGVFRGPTVSELDQGLAQNGDGFVYLAAKNLKGAPTPVDKLLFADATWRVLNVLNTYSGEKVCLYTLHVRT